MPDAGREAAPCDHHRDVLCVSCSPSITRPYPTEWPCARCAVSMNDPNPACPSWQAGMGNHPSAVTRWSSSWDCPRCQADEHVCPGCGDPIAHAAGACAACKEAS